MRRVLSLVHQTDSLSKQHHQGNHHPRKGVTQAAHQSSMAGLGHVHMVTQAHGCISHNACCLLGRWQLLEALGTTRANALPCTKVVQPALSRPVSAQVCRMRVHQTGLFLALPFNATDVMTLARTGSATLPRPNVLSTGVDFFGFLDSLLVFC